MKKREKVSTKMHAVLSNEDVREGVSSLLRRKLVWMRNATADLASRYGWGERKARNVFYGEGRPVTAADLLNMIASDDDVYAWVLEKTGRKEPFSEAQRRAILEILRQDNGNNRDRSA